MVRRNRNLVQVPIQQSKIRELQGLSNDGRTGVSAVWRLRFLSTVVQRHHADRFLALLNLYRKSPSGVLTSRCASASRGTPWASTTREDRSKVLRIAFS